TVGRVKMNSRLELDTDDTVRTLRKHDVLAILNVLVDLKDGRGDIDDIDHLGNRRVRSVGELMENQYRVGLLRMERAIRERMSSVEIDTVMPHDLINSLATYARVNQYGFIESPYRKVVDGTVTDDVIYLSAMDEGRYSIAQANCPVDADNHITDDLTNCRKNGDFVLCRPHEVDLIDVSAKQLVSVAAALIPFLENDDANRALMRSNMQRQAVPLIRAEAPFVGTGMEGVVARDSGAAIAARRTGAIDQVDGTVLVVPATEAL